MNDARYSVFYDDFAVQAKAYLKGLSELVKRRFGRELTEISEMYFDKEKGFGFGVAVAPELFVTLILTDGEVRGFDGIGLLMTCSPRLDGVLSEYVPGTISTFGDDFRLAEIKKAFGMLGMDMSTTAERIQQNWLDIEVQAVTRKDVLHES